MEYLTLLILVVAFLEVTLAVDEDCEFYQYLEAGKMYYISNPEYPNYNTRPRSCRWYAKSATKIKLSCEVTLLATTRCAGDRFSISPSGDFGFSDAENICASGNFDITSVGDSMVIDFVAFFGTRGGRFRCNMHAVQGTRSNCSCGWSNPARITSRIAGGTETAVNEYPMMAGLVITKSRLLYCGGTIISTKHVLTAAHCRPRDTSVQELGILVGDHNITTGADTNSSRFHLISSFVSHPLYFPKTQINDIAVITVVDIIVFNEAVGPACLPFRYASASFANTEVTALGWGTLEFSGATSDTLQKVMLDVITLPECQRKYDTVISRNQFCTYTEGKDACQFDSGGPLLWQNPNTNRLVSAGVVSYGKTCADDSPGVNTRVGAYLNWIVSVTPEVNYCRLE